MNKLKKRLSSLLVFLFCIFSLSAVETKVVETRHFKIIYDERTENAAKEIYSFAEDAYTSLVHFFKDGLDGSHAFFVSSCAVHGELVEVAELLLDGALLVALALKQLCEQGVYANVVVFSQLVEAAVTRVGCW